MLVEQMIVLALIQGITEFLPISSSGHLILVPWLTGWADQGLLVDVMVHLGSLLAILVYFRRDVAALIGGLVNLLRGRPSPEGRLALYIAAATVPAVLFGIFAKKSGLIDSVRGPQIVAWNAVIFGLLMLAADWLSPLTKRMEEMKLGPALLIGVAQALAIIPGTSRSGVTITAARAMGFTRPEAARFSFLLGIPAIAGAGVLVLGEAIESGETIAADALITGGLTFFSALAAIAFLMAVLRRISLLPFVVYRLLLAGVLFWMMSSGWLPS
ncbi:MAG TPA: undecaprenyl-diphosphate phosphatase [Aestuariivirgaceae bacterium]|nr:undecaprenyl-diphosphate phosphatase [Aestuariivirgaceae bacterium]